MDEALTVDTAVTGWAIAAAVIAVMLGLGIYYLGLILTLALGGFTLAGTIIGFVLGVLAAAGDESGRDR